MQHADFVHLVRRFQHASVADSAAYRRSVAAFAALGYAWLVACFLAPLLALSWLVAEFVHGYFDAGLLLASLAAVGVVWCAVQALGCRLRPPEGVRLRPSDAPALFAALERIRRGVKGPALHEVVLDEELRAAIVQRSRLSPLGGAVHCLNLGLPLLLALDAQRVQVVLAHEYGHLRRDDGRFAAWIYRSRAHWRALYESCIGHRGAVAAATHAFLAWYSPRFVARSFALARQDEYEADRISARLLGGEVAAAALVELALKEDWLQRQFWPAHWARAADHAQPVGPYARMERQLVQPLPEDFARRALREALRRTSGVDDTHPVLRDRLDGLGVEARLPGWSRQGALDLLGDDAQRWIERFDRQWCARNAAAWKQHHSALGRIRRRVAQLQAQRARSADDWVELGDLQRRLQPDAPVRYCYAQALAVSPRHGEALKGLYLCLRPEQDQQRKACLERLHEASPPHRWWASRTALELLQEDAIRDDAALELWRTRLAEAEAAEARAWSELARQPFLQGAAHHDLGEFERYELETELARWPDVRCAWLLRRSLREFPSRRAYLLVLELPRLRAKQALALCRALEPGLGLPGPVLLLWTGQAPELATLGQHAKPLYDTRVQP